MLQSSPQTGQPIGNGAKVLGQYKQSINRKIKIRSQKWTQDHIKRINRPGLETTYTCKELQTTRVQGIILSNNHYLNLNTETRLTLIPTDWDRQNQVTTHSSQKERMSRVHRPNTEYNKRKTCYHIKIEKYKQLLPIKTSGDQTGQSSGIFQNQHKKI